MGDRKGKFETARGSGKPLPRPHTQGLEPPPWDPEAQFTSVGPRESLVLSLPKAWVNCFGKNTLFLKSQEFNVDENQMVSGATGVWDNTIEDS